MFLLRHGDFDLPVQEQKDNAPFDLITNILKSDLKTHNQLALYLKVLF